MSALRTIAIVGGGASGVLTAYHLRQLSIPARIVIVEPRPELALGLAYSSPSRQHLLNVPAGKISALPGHPDHFVEWLKADYDPNVDPTDFVPRAVFGQYLQSLIANLPEIEHLRTTVIDCRLQENHAQLSLANGSLLEADAVVLALGNFAPAPLPGVSAELEGNGVYCRSAWSDATYIDLDPDGPVTLIGTGLTAVDALLRLRESGHRGTITAVSRHGALPEAHAPYTPLTACALQGPAPHTARQLLRQVHRGLKSTTDWRAVIDSLRERTNQLWLALPLAEQKRFRRHLLRRWEIVRHRMAPVIAARISHELAQGTFVTRQGNLESIAPGAHGAHVQIRTNGGRLLRILAARVINCTGPDMNYQRVDSPLLKSLFHQGLIVPGPLGGGLWSGLDGALHAVDGTVSGILYTVGPGRLGTLLESIAIPELRYQAVQLANTLTALANRKGNDAIDRAA